MNRTITSATEHAAFETIRQEHEALRQKLRNIHSALADTETSAPQMEKLLNELQGALWTHFNNEETEGFFDEITRHAPQFTDRAGSLCKEHRKLLVEAVELCRFAAAGTPSMTWWRELSERCQDFSRRLMHHESEENRLLQQAYQEDIGTHD